MNPTLGYAAIYFYRKDDFGTQILLQKKDRGWRGIDVWTPFGGRLENEEDSITCIKREILEELNIIITDKQLQFVTEIPTTTKDGKTVPLYLYTAEFTWPLHTIQLNEGCGFAFWYTDELATLTMQPHEKIAAGEIVQIITH